MGSKTDGIDKRNLHFKSTTSGGSQIHAARDWFGQKLTIVNISTTICAARDGSESGAYVNGDRT